MTKPAKFTPFAKPAPSEDEVFDLGEFGQYGVAELTASRVARLDELQGTDTPEGEADVSSLGDAVEMLINVLATALEPVNGTDDADLADKLRKGYAEDKVSLDGLQRAVDAVTGLVAEERTRGN